MNLHDALRAAADYLHLNGDELVQYAEETPTFGGNMPYGGMSIDREEGQFLYALVRALTPVRALEIGVFQGVSSAHILAAMDANETGELVSVDISDKGVMPKAGGRWSFITADATTADLPAADFAYEDSDHQMPAVADILAKVKALRPRVVVSHDYYSHELYADNVGFQVKMAFNNVFGGGNVLGVRWDNAPRGFGLWLNTDWQAPSEYTVNGNTITHNRAPRVGENGGVAVKVERPAPRKRTPAKKATTKR